MAKVALLTGGSTPERPVALAGAAQVVPALRARGHAVTVIDTVYGVLAAERESELLRPSVGAAPPSASELREWQGRERLPSLLELPALRESDVVFPLLHGRQGEGGAVQALLELGGLRFVGSDTLGSALAMDKELSKRVLRDAAVPTPRWVSWSPAGGREQEAAIAALGWPLVVKPSRVGSTVGLTLVRRAADLDRAIGVALTFDDEVLLEQFIPGRELTVGVLEDRALAVGEIEPAHELFDFECKYTPGMARETFPARLAEELAAALRAAALRCHRALKLRHLSRVDFRLDGDRWYALEANTMPGMTATSLLPQSAAAVGISFSELCGRLVELAFAR